MELIVKNDTFYVLVAGEEKRIYTSENDAIASLKTMVSKKPDLDQDDLTIYAVKMGENWEIKSIPWSKIAIELIKGGTKNA